MKEVKFCQHCGQKREKKAAWCVACGHAFQKAASSKGPLPAVVAVVVLSVIVFAGVKLTVLKDKPEQTQTQTTSTDSNLPAGHPPIDNAHLQELIAHADTGHADGLLDLAEYQVTQSGKDRKFLADAAATLERFLLSWPDHAYAQRMAGNVYFDLGQSERSIDWYKKYLAQHPEDANIHTDMGTQFLMLNRVDDAIAQYMEALRIYPNFYNVYFNLSIAYDKKGDSETADEYRKKAQEVADSFGKTLAPEVQLARLPEGDPHAVAPQGEVKTQTANASTNSKYGTVETFFKDHPILSSKMEKFLVKDGVAQAWMRNFPMAAMPPNMRESLEAKIKAKLAEAGSDAVLELRDAADGSVMASYTP